MLLYYANKDDNSSFAALQTQMAVAQATAIDDNLVCLHTAGLPNMTGARRS